MHAEDPYLPLHAEARVLTKAAREAEIAYDELFLAFTAEDLLSAGRDSSIVHLAGHGRGGRWRCYWRGDREVAILTSQDLVDAWRDAPPRLFVLDFCESSSEADALRLAEAIKGAIALHAYSQQTFSREQNAPTSSMALDLVASLPTAVLALRTTADDTQAREFVGAFYDAHLVDGLPLEEAFAQAVAERGFHDDAGLPVPCLYISTDQPATHRDGTRASDQPGPVESLDDRQRRCLNTFYKAIGPLGRAMGGQRMCSVTGDIGDSRELLIESLRDATALWTSITAGVECPEPVVEVINDHHHLVKWTLGAEGHSVGVGIDLEGLPPDTTIGELLACRRRLAFEELLLVAYATCDVPPIVEAVIACNVGAIAKRLQKVAAGRSSLTDRKVRWDLASELIDCLPADRRSTIRAWSDAKWEKLQSFGPMAIDIFASRFLLSAYSWMMVTTVRALDHMVERLELNPEIVWAKLTELIAAGLAQRGVDLLANGTPPLLSLDLLTAARAWAACSDEAAHAFAEHAIDGEIVALGLDHGIDGQATGRLAALAQTCLTVGDPRAGRLLAELAVRDDGAAVAAKLRERADTTVRQAMDEHMAEDVPNAWDTWERLYQRGQLKEAASILDEIAEDPGGADHPLRIAVTRLGVTELSPSDLLAQATDIERQLIASLDDREATNTDLDLLLMTRQMKASAMHDLGTGIAAAEILQWHFVQAVSLGASPSQLVAAGASAVAALAQEGALAQAREVWDRIEGSVNGMRSSADRMAGHRWAASRTQRASRKAAG
ncbi:MAG: hypothetical protein ACRDK4_03050 [Solirubrobacteraceae bacterium]